MAKSKSVMAKTIIINKKRLHLGGLPIGRTRNVILAFPDTPAVAESGKASNPQRDTASYARGVALSPPLTRRASAPLARSEVKSIGHIDHLLCAGRQSPARSRLRRTTRKENLIMNLTMIVAISFFLSPLLVYGQDKGPQGRIVLEEEEVTLFDENGKEIEKRYVSKEGTEKAAIRRQVREKALKRMGLKSLDEIKGNRELNQKYLNEQGKFIKVKELKPLILKFMNDNKKVIKEVPICPPGSGDNNINITTKTADYWQSKGVKTTKSDVVKRKVRQLITREPIVSKSHDAAVISEMFSEFMMPISTNEQPGSTLESETSIEYYDDKGDMRWKKKSEDRDLILYARGLSEDGKIVAAIKTCEYACWRLSNKGIPLQQLEIYDSSGKDMLILPLTKELCPSYNGSFWLSLDGNFVKFDCMSEKGWPKSILIKIKERKFWKAPYLIGIGIGDDGYEIREGSKLRVGVTGDKELGSTSKEIDLEKLPWEPLPQ